MTDRETDREISRISRRGLLGAGAGAAAATLAGLSAFGNVHLAGAQEAGGDSSLGMRDPADPTGDVSAAGLPPAIPGTQTLSIGIASAMALNDLSASGLAFDDGVYNATTGWLDVPVLLPTGSTIVRIDVYAKSTGAAVSMILCSQPVSTAGANDPIDVITTNAATGIVHGTWTGSQVVALGQSPVLTYGATASSRFVGAIVTYYPANPELYLLAVPAGARAALVNVTIVGTQSSGGYLSLWKNGIAWPGTSTVNWDHVGETVASTAVVAVDGSAKFLAQAGGGATDFIVDVVGYFS